MDFHRTKGEDNINCISDKNKLESVLESRLDLRKKYCRRILYSRAINGMLEKDLGVGKTLAFTQGSEDGMGLRGTESHSCDYSLGAGTEKRLI